MAILLARKISDRLKADMEIYKSAKKKMNKTEKDYFNSRHNSLIKSCHSLQDISTDMIMSLISKCDVKEEEVVND